MSIRSVKENENNVQIVMASYISGITMMPINLTKILV